MGINITKEMIEEHNKTFAQKSIANFNKEDMKIFCVLAANKEDDVAVSMGEGLSREQMIKYFEGAIETMKSGIGI